MRPCPPASGIEPVPERLGQQCRGHPRRAFESFAALSISQELAGIITRGANGLYGRFISQRDHRSANMSVLWLTVFGAAAAVLLVAVYAKSILAAGSAFSSTGPLPLPGRFFGRRFKRWWRDVADTAPTNPAGPPLRLRAWPILDLKAGRLTGLLLEPLGPRPVDPTTEADDLVRLERAVAHGRRLGWRHSSTTVIVPVMGVGRLLENARSPAWQLLERYSGDEVATVPPLLLGLDDVAEVPQEAVLQRLARLRVGIALTVRRLSDGELPAVVERVFIDAPTALASPEAARAMSTTSRQVIVTGVADMAELENLAKARLHFATGRVFGTPKLLE